MILDRTHIKYGVVTAIASGITGVLYLANNRPDILSQWDVAIELPKFLGPVPPVESNVGATPLGLIYGTLALIIFLFAAMLGARRNQKWLPLGRIQLWLKAHIWLTIFTIPLVVFHCGFHGGGPMTQFLLWLYGFVMLSGFWGLALQHVMPKIMQEYLPEEVIFEQIPYIRSQLAARAIAIRTELETEPDEVTVTEHGGGTATVKTSQHLAGVKSTLEFIDKEAVPYLQVSGARHSALGRTQSSDNQFRLLKLQAPDTVQALLNDLNDICDEKRRLDLQTRLHYWLHGWLIVHAPASLFLVVLTIVHAVIAAYYYA